MKRLTPEREKEIRDSDPTHVGKAELLAEIDALRQELGIWKDSKIAWAEVHLAALKAVGVKIAD